VNREQRCRHNVQPTCHPGAGYYLPWVQQISRWSVDIPPNSSSRKTQHAIDLFERLCLSLNRKRAAPVVNLLVARFLEFKAITIFSLLFSAGIAMQADRFASPDFSTRIFLSRQLGWLFLLGATHLFLIWNGDILASAIWGLRNAAAAVPRPALGIAPRDGSGGDGLPGIRPFWTADSNGRLGHG
jgi:hypothetical protein